MNGVARQRHILEAVPPVHFYRGGPRCPEDLPFPSCLRAALAYLGEHLGCDHEAADDSAWRLGCGYAYLVGTSGLAFKLSWHTSIWDGGNVDITNLAQDALEPFRRGFASVGYGVQILLSPDLAARLGAGEAETGDAEAFRARIVASVDAGRPVLALGVVGPPECCLVTGYDGGGEVLIGWNFFQDMPELAGPLEREPNGMFRQSDWSSRTPALLLLGERHERPDLNELLRDTLRWALTLIRTPRVRQHHNGLAAYDAWMAALQRDDEFPADDPQTMDWRLMVHDDAVCAVAEARWYGSLFLALAARRLPFAAGALYQAAACYAAQHDLMWRAWAAVGGIGRAAKQRDALARPDVRRLLVPLVAAAKEREAEAATWIERAL